MCCNNGRTRVAEIKDPIQFRIGDGKTHTPLSGTSEYINPDLRLDRYLIERNGVGILHVDTDFKWRGDGGFDLIDTDEFSPGEKFTLAFY